MTRPRSARKALLSLFVGLTACAQRYVPPPPAPEEAPPQPTPVSLDSLPAGAELRLVSNSHRVEGRLRMALPDSLRLARPWGDTTLARADIEVAWLRGGESYGGTKAGAVAGVTLGALMLLAGSQGAQPESNGEAAVIALVLAGGGLGLGIVADMISPAPWIPLQVR